MLSKKALLIALIAAAALCAAEGFYLVKYLRPEVRFVQIYKERLSDVINKPTNVPPVVPEWLKDHPVLDFLGSEHEVVTVADDYKGPLFALRKPIGDSGDFQLWKIDAYGDPQLLTGGVIGYCDDVSLTITSSLPSKAGGYAVISNMNSPCEAGANYKDLYYSLADGNFAYETFYYSSGPVTINPKPSDENYKIKIDPVFVGSCEVADKKTENTPKAPSISFSGVSVTVGKNKKFFPISKPVNTSCEGVYGDEYAFVYPGFNSLNIQDGKAIITTSGVSTILDPQHPFTAPRFQ